MNTDDVLIRYLLGEADPVERTRIDRWLAADERNRERFRQFSAILDHTDRIAPPAPDWKAAYGRFKQRLQMDAGTAGGRRREDRRREASVISHLGGKWAIAALLTGFVCLAGVLFVARKKATNAVDRSTAVTVSGPGQVTLPDGSLVTLGSNTALSYGFGRQAADRTVYLKGQAFFSVTVDPSKPFVVRISDIAIKVLGTSFAVRETGDSTIVEMATGAVEVSKGRTKRVIRAGDTLWTYRDSEEMRVTAATVAPVARKTSAALRATPTTTARPTTPVDTSIGVGDQREIVRSIIRDIVKEKIVSGADDIIWFGLDNGQFIVNDRHMPDSLLIRFRSKYIRPDGLGFYYGSVKVAGHGYFFTKQELNGQ